MKRRKIAKNVESGGKKQQKLTDMLDRTVSEHRPNPITNIPDKEKDDPDKVIKPFKESEENLPVSFQDFIKYTNVFDIVKKAIITQRPKTYESLISNQRVVLTTAHNAYLTFYTRPKYRSITPIAVNNDCPIELKEKIFEIPEKYDRKRHCNAKKLNALLTKEDSNLNIENNQDLPNKERDGCSVSENYANKPVDAIFASIFRFPVSLLQFKTNTFCDMTVDQIIYDVCYENADEFKKMRNNTEFREKILIDYYHSFYMNPVIRKMYPLKLKPCPAKMHEQILRIPYHNNQDQNFS